MFIHMLQGPFGFYKGMAAPVVGVTPIFALSFFGFNVGKALQQDKPDDPLTLVSLFACFSILTFCWHLFVSIPHAILSAVHGLRKDFCCLIY